MNPNYYVHKFEYPTKRRDDELELKKAVMANQAANEKDETFGMKNKIARFQMPKWNEAGQVVGWEEDMTTAIVREGNKGTVLATITDRDGSNPRELNITDFDYRTIDAPDSALIAKFNDKINQKVNALKGTKEALSIIQSRPELIGSKGQLTMGWDATVDIIKSHFGAQTFEKYFADFARDKSQFMDNQKIAKEEAAKLNPDGKLTKDQVEFFDKEMSDGLAWWSEGRDALAASMDKSTDLQIQAKLKTTELLTSYALANLLKNEDRLAVQDIKRAEKATKLFGWTTSPEMAIAKYLTLEKNLTDAIDADMKQANILGIKNDQIVAYNEGLTLTNAGTAEDKKFRDNLKTIISEHPDIDLDVINQITGQLFEGFQGAIIGEEE